MIMESLQVFHVQPFKEYQKMNTDYHKFIRVTHPAAHAGIDHVLGSPDAGVGQTLGRAGAVVVLWLLLGGAEHLDGGEAAHAELAGQRLVLIGVHCAHLHHTLPQERGGG